MSTEEFDWGRLLRQYKIVKKKEFLIIEQLKALRQDALDNWPKGETEILGEDVRLVRYEGFRKWEFTEEFQRLLDAEKANPRTKKHMVPFLALQAPKEDEGWQTYYRSLKTTKDQE